MSTPTTQGTRWLPFGAPSTAETRVFCFPHAGASAAVFAQWQRIVGESIRICPAQPPGRAERLREEPHRDVRSMVDDVVSSLDSQFTGTYALFGHSMGALVVFELARRLRSIGAPPPAHVFVSGRPAPQLPEKRLQLRDLPIPRLVGELRSMGGTPDLLLRDPELLEAFLPMMRADFSVNEAYAYRVEPPLSVGLSALGGWADPRATEPELRGWSAQTSSRFACHLFPGGHFYAEQHAGQVLDIIRDELT
ncbi:MAG: alpha/beta fold hydrolase [Actinophytocola sp.]|uniref:thioesterase II family protein n=1 Tax=Actinophytocola sp. TaxID=1872138 RepID=UPI00132836E0|nr:thioesterase domain-containing protein [Actinophytocola sp.]MPZ81176.1 alpha/beta fold hydrolase [Actinophytocola sp.]